METIIEIVKNWLKKNLAALTCVGLTILLLFVVDLRFKEWFADNPSYHAVLCSVLATFLVGFTTPNLRKMIDKKVVIESVKKTLRPNVINLSKGISKIDVFLQGNGSIPKNRKLN